MKSAFMNDFCRAFVIWAIVEQQAFSFGAFKILAGCRMPGESQLLGILGSFLHDSAVACR